MKGNKRDILSVLLFSILCTILFHKQDLGLNLIIAETIILSWLIYTKQFKFKGYYSIAVGIGLIITLLSTLFTHSLFSYILHFIVLFIFIGLLIYPQTKSLYFSFGQAFTNLFTSHGELYNKLTSSKLKGRSLKSYIKKIGIFIVPVLIIIFFIIIYRNSNPVFDTLIDEISRFLGKKLDFIFENLDFYLISSFIGYVLISTFILIRTSNENLKIMDKNSNEELVRKRKINLRFFKFNALTNEYKSGVFLLITLNLMLLILNIIDIKWVWFGFEWEGQFLRQFVHEGTYLLILSILISIILVLYYFRRNINFLKNNRLLKYLSYIWLIQNAILTFSVGMRNFWYISYFSLAYKRIGVIIFLILTIYGLYTVYVKVKNRKSAFYLFKSNFNSFLLVLVLSSLFNWDSVIAKYNFRNADTSFLHLNYMVTLSDKALPYLDKSILELEKINKVQNQKFRFEQEYMTPERYSSIIDNRKENFIKKWENKSTLSWNYPEYKAYKIIVKEWD
ncbi:DUF4153 domain-containing protein [Brumimicrobium mesophilum]|uniref:DUF4153 domain-containing protein n=1 Tax=Brumimicrobium mesophilum TaxID=392717 RepID=UPI000D144A06|nr:DUF4153 domain-containing protein [Brumimicrobium mesophilum]